MHWSIVRRKRWLGSNGNQLLSISIVCCLFKKFERSGVIKTCSEKGIPEIKRENLEQVMPKAIGSEYHDVVCEARWIRTNGKKVCGSSYH